MSSSDDVAGRSRLSNQSNPASVSIGPDEPDFNSRPDVPFPDERIAEVLAKFPDRAMTRLTETHGRKVRKDAMGEKVTASTEVEIDETGQTKTVTDTVAWPADTWIGALESMLEWYEDYRGLELKMSRGSRAYGDYEDFQVGLENSFSPVYQERQYAQLKALERQLLGGDYEEYDAAESGAYEVPVTVLMGLTSSSLTDSREYRCSIEHDREIREAWSGSSNSVKRTLRYVLDERLGLDSTDYSWHWQAEPHPGGGDAAGYSHAHPVVVFDAAAITTDVTLEDVTENEFWRPVVAKHVDICEGAEWSAHRITEGEKSAVNAKDGREIKDFASYVAEYIATDPDEDLLERSAEYLLWSASQWASSSQKYSRSRSATAAIGADRCQQQYMSAESEQVHEHGSRIVRSDRPGISFECFECGSHHAISQSESSLGKARLLLDDDDSASTSPESEPEPEPDSEGPTVFAGRNVSERWPSARSVASVGEPVRPRECSHSEPDTCPLCATETESPDHTVSGEVPLPVSAVAPDARGWSVGELRAPEWRPESIVETYADEEHQIGAPSGVEYARVVVEGTETVMGKTDWPYLPPASRLEGPEPWLESGLFTESDVRSGLVPPPEIVAREWGETLDPARRPSAKEWSADWYAERFEIGDHDLDDGPTVDVDREAVLRVARLDGVTSVPSVLGRLGLSPDLADDVAAVLSDL